MTLYSDSMLAHGCGWHLPCCNQLGLSVVQIEKRDTVSRGGVFTWPAT